MGSPKEHIVKSLQNYIKALKQNKGIEVLSEDYAEPEQQNEVWSTFVEVDVLVEGIEKFVYVCFTFTPASIEILAPEELTFSEKNMTDWLNELLSLLHELGLTVKQTKQENQILKKSLNNLMRNIIVLGLDAPMQKKALAKKIGADEKLLEPFLDAMEKEKRIIKKGTTYSKNG